MSMATKRESLLQEGLRRLRNMDCSISRDERNKVMSTFSNAMRISGYNWEYRFNMIKGITQRYQECERLISEGSRVRYQTGAQILEQKQNRNGKSINTWFLKGEFTNVLKVQCTPEGRLRDVVQKTMDKCVGPDKGKTKVVEAAGIPVTSGVKKDPFIINECNYIEKCDSDQNTDCSKSNVVYRVTCMLCKENDIKSVYTGTTGCSLHKRLIEHSNAVNNQDSKNAMYKHMSGKHPGAEPKFSTMVLDRQKFKIRRMQCTNT